MRAVAESTRAVAKRGDATATSSRRQSSGARSPSIGGVSPTPSCKLSAWSQSPAIRLSHRGSRPERFPGRARCTSPARCTPSFRVPMREIALTPTLSGRGAEQRIVEENPPLLVYDTSGPYTDEAAAIDVRRGLPALRGRWIAERGDTEEIVGRTYRRSTTGAARSGRHASTTPLAARRPRRALAGRRGDADALRAPRHGHAGDGVRRHPREPAARALASAALGHRRRRRARGAPRRPAVRRPAPARDHSRVRARRGGARPRDHPGQRQPPRARADGDRPQLPGEDQRQHRQLRGHLLDRGGGREDGVGHPLGRRHGDGPVDRARHPRDARVDPAQQPGADRHGADLPGAREGGRQGRGPHLGDLSATR